MIPDLTHYAQGLDAATFPLRIKDTLDDDSNTLSVEFTIMTLEQWTAQVLMDSQGFQLLSLSTDTTDSAIHSALTSTPTSTSTSASASSSITSFSERQQEALSGKIYETIEALLMALSPGFEQFFGQELIRRLETVSWDRFQQQHDHSESENDS
ncbi:hypothetical protein BX616_009208 [Lobosporangium transversale]|nr:hypothetical protein BX616_009208 [Lobosporangium transversale]